MPGTRPRIETWRPTLGAIPEGGGTTFRVWSSRARAIEVEIESRGRTPLSAMGGGMFEAHVEGVGAGARYRYLLDGEGPFPDPASRHQPLGVHGPSEVVDPSAFTWSDPVWRGIALEDLVLYELHVGAFTREGTFAAASARLPELRDLGVTAVELMPIADFPGERNWGYDGAALFAPARCYGTPDDLRRLVDHAHRLGIAVHLDVVYNHLGPDGAYLAAFSPAVFSDRHESPWGAGINLDGPGSQAVRDFFIENALHWIHEYHLDGLRLDATHAMVDESERHFLAELAARLHARAPAHTVLLIAEDARNLAHMVKPEAQGGWRMDAVWSDDFHHEMRCLLAGDRDGYFEDYDGTVSDLATTIRQGWFFTGQRSRHWQLARGTDPKGLDPQRFVVCIQNHDQVGNRAFGERLNHQIDLAAFRAATAVLLTAPETPLLFMGQEWAASSPFPFFTDHAGDLGRQVTEGRRQEFKSFAAFADPEVRARIPDPQAESTFEHSRLDWEERGREPHASMLRLTQALLRLRRGEPALRAGAGVRFDARALDDDTLMVRREIAGGATLVVVARLRGAGVVKVPLGAGGVDVAVALSTEDPLFATDPRPIEIDTGGAELSLRFARASAIVLRLAVAP